MTERLQNAKAIKQATQGKSRGARGFFIRAIAVTGFGAALLSVSNLPATKFLDSNFLASNFLDSKFLDTRAVRRTTVHSISLASGRDPAMMRVNPKVHGVRLENAIGTRDVVEAVNGSVLGSAKRELALGLVTRTADFTRGGDARNVARVREIGLNYGMILPASLSASSDAGSISAQIFDHSITSFLNQASIKNSFVGQAADTVEKRMKTEVAIGGIEPDSIQHKIKFQMKASETKASMEYRGLTNADLSYSIGSRKTNLEIYEKIGTSSNLVYTHSDEPSDRRDVVSLRLNW